MMLIRMEGPGSSIIMLSLGANSRASTLRRLARRGDHPVE
jgi:hypothetical protein